MARNIPFKWIDVFSSNYSYGFDEMPGMNVIYSQTLELKWNKKLEIINPDPYLYRIGGRFPKIFIWDNGSIK